MTTINFKTGNSAFQHEDGSLDLQEIAGTIKAVADMIALGTEEGLIRDFNGNTVGSFSVGDQVGERRDTCWYCGGKLIWWGDHDLSDIEEDPDANGIYTELGCKDCGAVVTYTLDENREK